MKQLAFLAISGVVLAACNSADAASPLRDDCTILASDPAAQENFAERGLTTERFCDCVVGYIEAQPDTEQAQMTTALEAMTDEMQENEVGADAAIGTLMGEAQEMEEEAAQTLRSGVRLLGGMMNEFGEDFGAEDACPAP